MTPVPNSTPATPLWTREMRWLLALFLITTLGGALRKWFINSPAIGNAVLGIQMVIPFAMFITRSANSVSPFKTFGLLYIYFFYLGFHIIYPLQLTPYHGLFGMLVHGGFWIGLFFYLANRHLFRTEGLMKIILIVVALELVLAFIQYNLPQSHFLNKYAREGQSIAVVNDRVRVTGTFSYLSGYTAFLIFYPLMVWGLIRLKYPQWFVLSIMAMGIAVSFMTGSRSAAVIMIVLVGALLLTEYPITSVFRLVGQLFIPVMILLAISALFREFPLLDQIELAYNNFMVRVESNRASGEERTRFFTDIWYVQNAYFRNPVFGIGLGSTYQGATILFGTSMYVYEFGYVETEFTRILLEGGWTIILLRYILTWQMAMALSFKGFMRWAIVFVVAVGQPIVFNPHNAAFLLLGIILVDNIIWRKGLEARSMIQPEVPADAAPLPPAKAATT